MVAISHLVCAYFRNFWVSPGHARCTLLANNRFTLMLPMLCDITIYYSYLKLLYNYWMQPLPLRHVYGCMCPLFGVWHPYKYCVDYRVGFTRSRFYNPT